MEIIDVLNKIANGEEMPKRIMYMGEQYDYDKDNKDYTYPDKYNTDIWLFDKYNATNIINDEIEIIEEPKEELEEIELLDTPYIKSENDFAVEKKINELIANQNKIIRELKANK